MKIDYLAWLKTCPQHPQLRFQSGQQLLFHFESYHPVKIGPDKKPMVTTVLYGVWLRSGGKAISFNAALRSLQEKGVFGPSQTTETLSYGHYLATEAQEVDNLNPLIVKDDKKEIFLLALGGRPKL